MLILGTVAALGWATAIAGPAFACDKATKTAAAGSCSKDASQASATAASTQAASCCAQGATKTTTAGNVHKSMIKSAMVAPGASPAINTAAFAANMNGSTVAAGNGSCCESKSAGAAAGTASCDKATAVNTAGAGHCDATTKTAGMSGTCEKSTQTAAASVDAIPYREDKRLVLTGVYECGHCEVGATAECTPMFKTADGKVYPLWNSDRVSALRNDKTTKNVEIATVVKKVDGVKYLDVKSFKTL
jgi:hypothetical protein